MTRRRIRPLWWDARSIWLAALTTAIVGSLTVALFWLERHPGLGQGGRACMQAYADARTPADTARIDARVLGAGRRAAPYTCGILRAVGELTR